MSEELELLKKDSAPWRCLVWPL